MRRAFVRFPYTVVLAGACAALAFSGCSKHTDSSQTTTTTTDTSTAMPAGAAATAPGDAAAGGAAPTATAMSAAATPAGEAAAATTPAAAPSGSFRFIDVPVYPGAREDPAQHLSMSSGDGSVDMHVYATKDDSKRVAEWYKSHLPANWKSEILTANDKTVGTFDQEQSGVGDQSVIVADNNGSTRVQITTKKGK
ncbi:MAG TPA: hypothetical protein VFB22_15575 [Candidatus Baltobacteraceae bacterium]|nr:hypothetical protein [Candidatus Baltobacteraceae bacterium]